MGTQLGATGTALEVASDTRVGLVSLKVDLVVAVLVITLALLILLIHAPCHNDDTLYS